MQDLGPTTDRGKPLSADLKQPLNAEFWPHPPTVSGSSQGWGAGFILGSPREPDVQPLGKVPHLPDFPNL